MPVPKAYCLCEDEGVIGTPFYIMEFLDGRIIEDPGMPGVGEGERREMYGFFFLLLLACCYFTIDVVGEGNANVLWK